MKLRKGLLIFVALAALPMAVAIFLWVAAQRDPVETLVASIKKEYIYSEIYPVPWQFEDAGLGNRAAPRVLELLDDDDPQVRKRAAEALAQIRADGSVIIPKLLEKRFDPDPSVRDAVFWGLGRARPTNDTVIDLFIEQSADKDPRVKQRAAYVLVHMLPQSKRALPAIMPILIKALDDPKNKSGPAHALGKIGPEAREAIPRLRKVATTDGDDYDRTVAITALRKIEGDSDFVISALIDLLKCDYPYARGYAARTLGDIGPRAERAIPALQYILDHPPTNSPAPSAPPAAAGKPSKLLPFSTTPTTGTVGLATLENTYPQLKAEVLEAIRKIRPSANKNGRD